MFRARTGKKIRWKLPGQRISTVFVSLRSRRLSAQEQETVCLNQAQMAELFDRDVKTIGKHITNVLAEEVNPYDLPLWQHI